MSVHDDSDGYDDGQDDADGVNGTGKAESSTDTRSAKGRDYEVGYGKPPRRTQFKPGQSGNPRGRAKGKRGMRTDLGAELSARHTIQFDNKPVRDTGQRLALKTLVTRAAHGDLKAQALLFPMIERIIGFDDRGAKAERLSARDQAMLDAMIADLDLELGEPEPPEDDASLEHPHNGPGYEEDGDA